MLRRFFRLAPRSAAQVGAEMREEIESHIMLGVDEMVSRGIPREEAEAALRSRYHDLITNLPALIASAQRRSSRRSRRELLPDVGRDLVFGLRQLRRAPVLALGVTLCLGFGIGASAMVFSWMEGLVLRPFPAVGNIDRLVSVRPDPRDGFGISIDELEEWQDQTKTTSGLTGVSLTLFNPADECQLVA
jgi:hypothetical protein